MRNQLDGKQYVEEYVQTLTHELKSPLSAIKGASEILQMPLPEEKVARFAGNIERESDRMQSLIDKLLELARLEKRLELEQVEAISLKQMVNEVVESADARLSAKSVIANVQIDDHLGVLGDAFLLKQAVLT